MITITTNTPGKGMQAVEFEGSFVVLSPLNLRSIVSGDILKMLLPKEASTILITWNGSEMVLLSKWTKGIILKKNSPNSWTLWLENRDVVVRLKVEYQQEE